MSDYKNNLFKGASAKILASGRTLRKQPTIAEQILWEQLRNRKVKGCKFRRQHALGSYIADFYCHEAKLVIEVDGLIHDAKEQQAYDANRTKDLKLMGITVIRFTNNEVEHSLQHILKVIAES